MHVCVSEHCQLLVSVEPPQHRALVLYLKVHTVTQHKLCAQSSHPTSLGDGFAASCPRGESGAVDTTSLSAYPVCGPPVPPGRA